MASWSRGVLDGEAGYVMNAPPKRKGSAKTPLNPFATTRRTIANYRRLNRAATAPRLTTRPRSFGGFWLEISA